MSSPRVLQVLPALEMGGVEKGTLEIGRALVERGFHSCVISAGGQLAKPLEQQGSRHFKIDAGKKSLLSLRHVHSIREIIIKEKINIIHVRSRMPAWVVFIAWKTLPEKERPVLISTVHGPYSVNFYSAIMMKAEYIIAISHFIHDYILSNYPETKKKPITIIPRGIDSSVYYPAFKPQADWHCPWQDKLEANKTILTLPGRITHWKGQMDFIELINILKSRGLNIIGIIAGAPHKKRKKFHQSLLDKVRDYGLEDDIRFIGQRNDMREVMSASDIIFSLAKIPEAFGRTALEGLCLGVPVVAYDHGGASEVLGVMFPEGLVTANDVNSVADKTQSLITNKKTIVNQNPFTLDRMLNETLAVYQSALDQQD